MTRARRGGLAAGKRAAGDVAHGILIVVYLVIAWKARDNWWVVGLMLALVAVEIVEISGRYVERGEEE